MGTGQKIKAADNLGFSGRYNGKVKKAWNKSELAMDNPDRGGAISVGSRKEAMVGLEAEKQR